MIRVHSIGNAIGVIVFFPIAAWMVSVTASSFTDAEPMFFLAALALLAGTGTVFALDILYRAAGVEKKDKIVAILLVIFIVLAYPLKDLSLLLLRFMGVFYIWIDDVLSKYFYASYFVSGAIFNFAIRI